jgi:predicted membrane protein
MKRTSLKTKKLASIIIIFIFLFIIYIKPELSLDAIIFLPVLIFYAIILFFVKEENQIKYQNILNKIIIIYVVLSIFFLILSIYFGIGY